MDVGGGLAGIIIYRWSAKTHVRRGKQINEDLEGIEIAFGNGVSGFHFVHKIISTDAAMGGHLRPWHSGTGPKPRERPSIVESTAFHITMSSLGTEAGSIAFDCIAISYEGCCGSLEA
jgi:hypothetical protein